MKRARLWILLSWLVPSGAAAQEEGRADLNELLRLGEGFWQKLGAGGSELSAAAAFLDRHHLNPEIGGVVSGSGIGFGLTHTAWEGAGSALGWNALLTSEGYKELGLFHLKELGSSGRVSWRNRIRYRDLASEDFFGLGMESLRENRSYYRLQETMAATELGFELAENLHLAVGTGVRRLEASNGASADLAELFPLDALRGTRGAFHYASLGVGISFSTLDYPGYPRRGSLVEAELTQFVGLDGNSPPYRRFVLELQKAIPLPGYDHSLATRLRADLLDRDGEGSLPFFLSRGLGGSHSLRSFPLNRFRGEDLLLGTLEYRFALLPDKLDGVFFWDLGSVQGAPGELGLDRLQHSFGAGIRLLKSRNVLLRLEVATGAEGPRVLLSFSRPF